jgi:hypothetical protein
MPLPKKTIRVFPNPWIFIHHDHGPQGVCHRDTGGRGADPSFVGAELDTAKTRFTEERQADKGDHRHNRQVTVFRFLALNAALTGPAEDAASGIELPKTPYYLDRLRDGDLVPADAATAGANPCKFNTLAEARAAGVAVFEANYGEGVFVEAFPELADSSPPKADKATTSGAPAGTTTTEDASAAGGGSSTTSAADSKADAPATSGAPADTSSSAAATSTEPAESKAVKAGKGGSK